MRDQHEQAWRYRLALFANAVTDDLHRNVAQTVDAWFSAWSSPDAEERRPRLTALATPDVCFADRFGAVQGREELLVHIAAVHAFMAGTRVAREGAVRHCQGQALSDWTAAPAGGHPAGRCTNLFVLAADGRIEAVTGFRSP